MSAPLRCPECGCNLIYKFGKYGRFLGCSGYPACKYIARDHKEAPELVKTCSACLEVKPLHKFYNKRAAPDGKQSRCIQCYKTNIYSNEDTMVKICTKCNKSLPLSMYNKCTKAKDGLQRRCKDCIRLYPSAILRRENAKTHRKPYKKSSSASTVEMYTKTQTPAPDADTKSGYNYNWFILYSVIIIFMVYLYIYMYAHK